MIFLRLKTSLKLLTNSMKFDAATRSFEMKIYDSLVPFSAGIKVCNAKPAPLPCNAGNAGNVESTVVRSRDRSAGRKQTMLPG